MKLYRKVPRLPDEMLESWLHRLAEENEIDRDILFREYLNKKNLIDAINYSVLIKTLENIDDVLDLFVDSGIYCFEGLGESDKCRAVKVAKYNLERNSFSSIRMGRMSGWIFRLCPECIKEDISRYGTMYFHRVHNLPEVCVCYKHGCTLIRTDSRNIFDLAKAEQLDIEGNVELSRKYAVLCKRILDAEFSLGADDIAGLIKRNVTSNVRQLQQEYKKSPYVAISKVAYKYFYECCSGNGVYLPGMLALLMYMYDGDIDKLYDDLKNIETDKEKQLKTLPYGYEVVKRRGFINRYRHKKCGTEFCQVDKGVEIFGCPKCDKLTFDEFVDRLTDGEYECKGADDNNGYYFEHKKCGKVSRHTIESLITKSGDKCSCEVLVGFEKASSKADKKGFDLLEYTNTIIPALFRCRKCGSQFSLQFDRFVSEISPCNNCNETKRKDFARKVRDVYGDEFTALGEYIDAKTDILIRHNVCGHDYIYQPNRFLMRKVGCRYCNGEGKLGARVGDISTAKNGMKMTIIAAHEGGLVDVQFEDGAIRRNVKYSHFNDGGVGNIEAGAAKTVKKRAEVEGEEIRNEINGKMMKIIKFESYHSVHVLVEDGSTFITSLNMFRKARLRYWQSKTYVPSAENSEKQI